MSESSFNLGQQPEYLLAEGWRKLTAPPGAGKHLQALVRRSFETIRDELGRKPAAQYKDGLDIKDLDGFDLRRFADDPIPLSMYVWYERCMKREAELCARRASFFQPYKPENSPELIGTCLAHFDATYPLGKPGPIHLEYMSVADIREA